MPDEIRLHWQSQAVLLLTATPAAVYAALRIADSPLAVTAEVALFAVLLGALVLRMRAATTGAAFAGVTFALAYGLTPTYGHSPLWILSLMLVLTLGATRIGKRRKQAHGTGEGKRGRTAAQVAANIGVGALAGALINPEGMLVAQTAMLAALGEATADTLASELGQLARTPPRMLLTGRQAAPGTDGAVSLPGTAAGVAGAALLCVTARWVFLLPWNFALLAGISGVFGLFFDSVLGELAERRGLLNNDAVNFLSTVAAALLALRAVRML